MHENSKAVLKSHRRKKEYHLTRMGGKCVHCGYSRCMDALDFHHVGKKTDAPSRMIRNHSVDDPRVLKELSQCVVLCSNCHREVHAMNTELDYHVQNIKPWKSLSCKSCGKDFKTQSDDQQFCCPRCARSSERRVNRPSREQLLEEIRTIPITKISAKYGVVHTSIRKWCEQYGIDHRSESPFSLKRSRGV